MGDGAQPGLSADASREFTTTHWSVVLAAGHGTDAHAAEALEQLCRTYWYPLYAHVRRRGSSPEDAQDLTQEFFARLLARSWLGLADDQRGRFRSFLLAAFDHFLANEWDRAHYQKRAGRNPQERRASAEAALRRTAPGRDRPHRRQSGGD